ncbi:MAG: hypothetical protein JWR61_478 [Ferruginibacter sp.]|uniref:hypothetical protein n=1 Tax=Ferruginibacter sp. TaxID=1940288 RepID=UPI002659020A|nr:hypothetical protein [Ferruginibacter sp.]MDB5275523.1 hypothetical protein [Ferruginibacter sp.]
MNRTIKAVIVYLVVLFLFMLLSQWLEISDYKISISQNKMVITPMMITSSFGGIILVGFVLSFKSFKTFLLFYFGLWLLRFILLWIGNQIGQIHLWNRTFQADWIIANYCTYIFRLDAPFSFIIFLFVYTVFSKREKKNQIRIEE